MKFFQKFFGSKVDQTITTGNIEQSVVLQSARDIILQVPPELMEKLIIMESKRQTVEYPKVIEASEVGTSIETLSDEIFVKLMQKTINEIKLAVDTGKLSKAQEVLSEIIDTTGFELIGDNYKIELFYYRGIIHLNRKHMDDVIGCIEEMEKISSSNKYTFTLMYKLAIEKNDNRLLLQAIEGLKNAGVKEDEIKLKMLFYEITNNNFSSVIKELAELDSIKEEFQDNADALYYLALAYFQLGNFRLAKEFLIKSNELMPLLYKSYLIILSEVIPLTHRTGVMYLITDQEKSLLSQKLDDLLEIRDYFNEKSIEMQEEYWGYVLNIKLFVNPSEIVSDVERMPENLKQSGNIQLMLAEAYSLIGTGDKAEKIYRALYDKLKNSKILGKIVTRLLEMKDYEGVLSLLDNISYTEYDEEGDIAGSYILAYSKVNGFSDTISKIEELEKKFQNAPLFYESASLIAHQNQEQETASAFMAKAISLINDENESLRIFISNTCEKIGLLEQAVEVLLPIRDASRKVKETLLNLALQFEDDEEKLELADKIIKDLTLDVGNDANILEAQAELALKRDNPKGALKPLIDSFNMQPSIKSAYNIVAVKLTIKESEGLQQYIDFLLQSKYPQARMIAALGLDFLGNRGSAEENAYKSLQLLEDNFDDTVYLQYSMLFMVSKNRLRDENVTVEYERIRADFVVVLEDNTGTKRCICIESNPELVKVEGQKYLNCEHYSISSPTSIQLVNLELNQKTEIDGIEYFVKQILNKYVYAFQFVSSEYIKHRPNSLQLQSVQVSEDDPITPILPFLEQDKKHNDFLLEQYNFANNIGLPISALCGNNYFKYPAAMQHLFGKKEQVFYAGEVADNGILTEQPLVLTISSLVLLKFLNHLDIIKNNREKFIISSSLLNQVRILFDEAITINTQVSGYMVMGESGRPIYIPLTDEEKQGTINFWREIYLLLQCLTVVDEVNEIPMEINLGDMVSQFEVDAIFLANKINGILLSDDLFIRKIARFINESATTINTVTVLERYLNTEQLLDALYTLSKYQYHQYLNLNLVKRLVNDCFIEKTIIYGDGTDIDKFTQLIRNAVLHPVIFRNYLPLFREVVFELYENRINHKSEEIIEIIIRELLLASKHYRVNTHVILTFFLIPTGIDVVKANFIKSIFAKY